MGGHFAVYRYVPVFQCEIASLLAAPVGGLPILGAAALATTPVTGTNRKYYNY